MTTLPETLARNDAAGGQAAGAAGENPDRRLIREFIGRPHLPVKVDSNPFAIALGMEMIGWDAGQSLMRMRFRPQGQFFQGNRVIQGGAVSAMLDFLMAFSSLAAVAGDQTVATMNLSTAFFAPARADVFEGWGTIDKRGRKAIFARAELCAQGTPVAMATSTLMILPWGGPSASS